MKKKFKKIIAFTYCFLSAFFAYSQEQLNNLNTSWSNVLTGSVVCEPVITSYGFCIVTDAKNIQSFTNSGILLWEKNIQKSKNLELTCLYEDFILLTDKQNKKLTLYNPSGSIIWTKNLNFSPLGSPLQGRDGRFFIYSEDMIECYGLNGIQKWQIQTKKNKQLPLQELPDGSIIIFQQETEGKTSGLRISPFGKIIEEIIFSGIVLKAYTCSEGICLIFNDNTTGLFSLEKNLSKNKWVLKNNGDLTPLDFAVSSNSDKVFLIQKQGKKTIINKINAKNGNVDFSLSCDIINPANIINFAVNNDYCFICDDKNSCIYNEDGQLVWYAKNPDQKKWNYVTLTHNNYLIFFYKDWSMDAYHIYDKNISNKEKKDYSNYFTVTDSQFDVLYSSHFDETLTAPQRIECLQKGNYAENEAVWISQVMSIMNMYIKHLNESSFGTRSQLSIFQKDSVGFEKILNQLLLFGISNTINLAADIISKETNKSFLQALLNGIIQNGYDPDEKLLLSLEILSEKVNPKDTVLINAICDSVYSICIFMGRPAYNSKGKEILKKFMYPQFSSVNRDYSRQVFKRIIDSDL